MSRSIHTTRHTVVALSRKKFSSADAKQAALKEAFADLARKRRIKRQVSEERAQTGPPLEGVALETIPVEVLDEGKFVHHGASARDIRAVLAALPGAATLGIAKIQLSLGKAYMEEQAHDEAPLRDPIVRRPSHTIFPGVYCGGVLGTYGTATGLVSVYAFVHDPAKLALPRPVCELYLRLHALKTLVHEVAHHHDRVARTARGRWRFDRKATVEWYAEQREHEWTRSVVLPYLERAYPKEASALRKWVGHYGGFKTGLKFFAGDTRRTERNGLERLVLPTSGAFENWVGELAKCQSLAESRLAFARQLHYADAYEDCLGVVDGILARQPECIAALTCKADTLVHLERFDEALSLAERVLRSEPTNSDAWETRGDVLEHRKDWKGLLINCDQWGAAGRLKRLARRKLQMHRAVACCALGLEPQMEKALQAYLATSRTRSEEQARRMGVFVRRRVFRRAGKPDPHAPPSA
jgi:hypothetical protein